MALIRGAVYLHQQGEDLDRCRELVRRGNDRLQRLWDEILKELGQTSAALGDDYLLAEVAELRMLRQGWREQNELRARARAAVARSQQLVRQSRRSTKIG